MPDFVRDAGKGNASKPPIGEIKELAWFPFFCRQDVPEKVIGGDIEPDPAIGTGEETVRLLKGDRPAALGALVFDFPRRGS
jgi:hypothetical protein